MWPTSAHIEILMRIRDLTGESRAQHPQSPGMTLYIHPLGLVSEKITAVGTG